MPLAAPRLLSWRPSVAPIPRNLYEYQAPAGFGLAGVAAGLSEQLQLAASAATYSLAASDAILHRDRYMVAATGNILTAYTDVVLTITRTLVATPATYSVNATATNLVVDTPMPAASTSYSIAGIDATLVYASKRVVAATASFALAGPDVRFPHVTFAWDAATDGAVVGYVVSYGTSPGVYSKSLDVGNVTQRSIFGVVQGTTYYGAVQGYNVAQALIDTQSNEASGPALG